MIHTDPTPDDTRMGLGRVEAFSDGVFSVAVTLLILNIQVPRLSSSDPASALAEQLLAQWPSYLSYAITFLTLGTVWISHHQILKYFRQVDTVLQTLNVIFLMFITVMPFTASLLALYIQQPDKLRIALAVYGGSWFVNGTCLRVMLQYANRQALLKPSVSEAMVRKQTITVSLGTMFSVVGAIFALFVPVLSFIIYALIALGYLLFPMRHLFAKRTS